VSAGGHPTPSLDLVPHVLEGRTTAIARLLSRVEVGGDEVLPALAAVYRHAGRAHVVGITGVPGSGKSSLVTKLAAELRRRGRRVAILAVDPSSPFSGGAILGDRIRMGELVRDEGVFIRSFATRGALGGLARPVLDAVDVVDAAGFDTVLVETVGVGQDEVEVVQAAHTTVVVSAPGLGDDIQAIKAGVLEIADVHVVSKADRPDAERTVAELRTMLAMGLAASAAGTDTYRPPVLATSAHTGAGVDELADAIAFHREAMQRSGELERRRRRIAERRLVAAAEGRLWQAFARRRDDDQLHALTERLLRRDVHPRAAADAWLAAGVLANDTVG